VSEPLVRHRSYDPYPGTDAVVFGERIKRLLELYDWQTTQVQFNLLDSHDTARLLSIARGDRATVRLATLLQMTYPGTPSVYYGDEIALRGTDAYDDLHQDHDARWPFPWHDRRQWDEQMLDYFKQAIALRRQHPVLRHGSYEELLARGHCYAFARSTADETLVIVVNAGDAATKIELPLKGKFPEGAALQSLFGPASDCRVHHDAITVSLAARSGSVIGRSE
jgi:glycosidase